MFRARDLLVTLPRPLETDRNATCLRRHCMSEDLQFNSVRRRLLQIAGATGTGLAAADLFATQAAVSPGQQRAPLKDPPMRSDPTLNTADLLVETLIAWDVPFVFGLVGDGINSITEALRKRQDRIRFITVRHEEAAAFMACGYAKHTGKLGVCLATTGPGAVHLLNGLYDAKMDSAPVLAITGTTFHDLIGTSFMQGVDTISLMRDVALYNVQVTGPLHARIVGNVACRAALSGRGVAHLSVAKDTQAMPLSADKPSMENHGLETAARWEPPQDVPSPDRLREAAAILNAGRKVAILAGQGALGARAEVTQVADTLGAPVAKALLGKAVLADDSPYTTGGIGHLGTAVKYQLPVKILVLSNRSLAEVRFEQEELGNPNFGCDLSPIDFAAYARACGASGFHCAALDEVRAAVRSFLSAEPGNTGRSCGCQRAARATGRIENMILAWTLIATVA
jgi:pyruvate dehydrogenase (quinone)